MRSTSILNKGSFFLFLLLSASLIAQTGNNNTPAPKPLPGNTAVPKPVAKPNDRSAPKTQTRVNAPNKAPISPTTTVGGPANTTAPAKDLVLFTLGGQPVYLSEFAYVYNKNNVDDKNSFTKASLEDYLDLYIKFRLKVKEAENLGMDTLTSLSSELETYRKQLSKQYLYDREVSEKLLQEAYDRSKLELNASHILIGIDEPALPADTLKAYKTALQLRNRLLKGEDFAELAKKYSKDPSAQTNNGNLGYFTVLQTVYPFEVMAYATPKGELSMPVRSRFGYHLIKVHDVREAQGEITVAHILLKIPMGADKAMIDQVRSQADNIYNLAIKGDQSFDELVNQYSEDKTTKTKGGLLPPFGTGRMVEEFEAAAFGLKKDGDVSKPVQTDYGFHIIKRISKKPQPTFEEAKGELKKKIERDSRSEIAKEKLIEAIKKEYKYTENVKARQELYKLIGNKLPEGKFVWDDKTTLNKTLFTLGNTIYTQADFVTYLENKQKKKRAEPAQIVFDQYYEVYQEEMLLAYEEGQLERKYPDFKSLMREYRDGILLFDLTDKKVWSKAVKDTTGLAAFYEGVKGKYLYPERVKVTSISVADAKTAEKVKKYAMKNGIDAAKAKYNKKDPNTVITTEGIFEKGQNPYADATGWKVGYGDIATAEGRSRFVYVSQVLAPSPKPLTEVKGFVVSEYQDFLEKEWIKELQTKYPVVVNNEVLLTLLKK
ncbi:peptidylprolyl isomerase [soil metagenome]